jgi:hypothetical protein
MDAPSNGNGYGYSANVRMRLFVNGHVLPISHLGPEFIILRTSIEHDPTDAEISLSIDGDEERWKVRLVDGIRADRRKTAIVAQMD